MEVSIERLDHQGRGIAKVDGITTFIFNALVDEIVDIEIIEKKKNYYIGKVKKYIKKSSKRIEPICPYFGICGGCDLMHMDYKEQLLFKQEKIKNIIERYTKIDSNKIAPILYTDDLYYRNKVIFHVSNGKIGFYDKKSNEIISIKKCFISSSKINEILDILNTCDLTGITEIMVRTNENDLVVVINTTNISDEIREKLKDKCSLVRYDNKYDIIFGNGNIISSIGDYKYKISPSSFYQVNSKNVKLLYDKVLEYLKPNSNDTILDLYSGTGTIGIYVSKYVKEVISVEINKDAVKDAKENAKMNNVNNIEFICNNVSNIIDQFKNNIDSIIVDPPRNGLDSKTINYLKNIQSKKIIYVSCDPITLARDSEKLSDIYEIQKITPVDMFPNTEHVENICILKRL